MILPILIAVSGFCLSCQETKAPTATMDAKTEVVETMVQETAASTIAVETIAPEVKETATKVEETKAPAPMPSKDIAQVTTEPTPIVAETTIEEAHQPESTPIVKEEKNTNIAEVVTETPKVEEVAEPVMETKAPAGHADFNAILQKHVKNGLVNYAGIKADGQLEGYLDFLSSNAPSTSDKSDDALAFWMNAYNAFTIKLIIDNYPLKSIMDLDNGKAWDRQWIKISGKTYSLNDIEHTIIRPVFNEPRIHFAVVCAAKSCPPLDNKAFTAATLEAHLEKLTKDFLNNNSFNQITEKKATVTPIFDWYAKDFGNVKDYVRKYSTLPLPEKFKLAYTGYDWALNKQ